MMFENDILIRRIEKLNLELARTKRERDQAIELGHICITLGLVESRANLEDSEEHGTFMHKSDARDLFYHLYELEVNDE